MVLSARGGSLGCFIAGTRVLLAGGPGASVVIAGAGVGFWGEAFLAWVEAHRVELALGVAAAALVAALHKARDEEGEAADSALESDPALGRPEGRVRIDAADRPEPAMLVGASPARIAESTPAPATVAVLTRSDAAPRVPRPRVAVPPPARRPRRRRLLPAAMLLLAGLLASGLPLRPAAPRAPRRTRPPPRPRRRRRSRTSASATAWSRATPRGPTPASPSPTRAPGGSPPCPWTTRRAAGLRSRCSVRHRGSRATARGSGRLCRWTFPRWA